MTPASVGVMTPTTHSHYPITWTLRIAVIVTAVAFFGIGLAIGPV